MRGRVLAQAFTLIVISGSYYFGPIIFNKENKDLWLKVISENSTLYKNNGLKFTFYETGDLGRFFSVFSRNTYFIPETIQENTEEGMIDIFDSEG